MEQLEKKRVLSDLLLARGYRSKKELADFCGVRPRIISEWLNPERGWAPRTREIRICRFFGLPDDAFLKGESLSEALSVIKNEEPNLEAKSASALLDDLVRRAEITTGESVGSLIRNQASVSYRCMLNSLRVTYDVVVPETKEEDRLRAERIFKKLISVMEQAVTDHKAGRQRSILDKNELLWLDEAVTVFEEGIEKLRALHGVRGMHVLKEICRGLEQRLYQLTVTGRQSPTL